MATRLKLAEKPAPTLSPERARLGAAIIKRDALAKRLAALEAAEASARDDEYGAQNDLEKWNEYLPSAVEAEVRNRVDEAIGKPVTKPAKSSAEAREAIANLEDTINTLKSTREALSKELDRTSRDFNIANGDVDVAISKIIETAPEVERLLNDLATATKTYETILEAVYSFPTPRHLQHLANPVNSDVWNRDQTLKKKWQSAFAALKHDASAPLPT
jgi:predicted  nucleic acid-binding Zn-ribbon protein